MKQGKMSEPRLSVLNDKQDLGTQKILKSLNQANPDADNRKKGNAPNLPKGWEIKKLGEVCDFQNGFAFQSKSYKEYGLPILRITNIQNDEIDTKDLVYFDAKDYKVNLDKFKVYKGDLLIAMSGATTGKLGINKSETVFYLNQRVGKFIPKKNLNKSFLYYFLTTKVEESLRIAAGAAQPNLSTEQINNFEIPLPPLPEQQRIVSILDECFAAIAKAKANAKKNLKNAKELFESYLQGVFEKKGEGWEIKTLGEIAFVKSGGTPLRHKTEYWSGDIAWYSSGELNNLYTTTPERHINELAIENSNAKLFPKGSLLIGMYDTAALKMSILDRDGTFNQAIAGVKPNPKIDLIFVLHAINAIKPEILNLRRGVRQKNLSLEKIKNIPISLPPLKEQQTIVRQLDALRAETQKLEAVYQKKIADLEELKKSILQKAFAGELRSPEGAIYPNDGYSPSEAKDGYSPSEKKKPTTIISPERA
jgi:type I restriction enzyme S subunit